MLDYRMVYYTASWCQPCKSFKPLATEEARRRDIGIQFVDVDHASEAMIFDNIMSLPTILIIDNASQLELDRVVGASLPTLKKTLDKLKR